MSATWCWLILHADLPPSERLVCFRTRDEQRAAARALREEADRLFLMHNREDAA